MKKYCIFIIIILAAALNSCATTKMAKQDAFPRMYNETPLTIAIAPPINEVSAADAGEFFLSTIAEPFSMHGYYIFSIPVLSDILKHEDAYNTLQEIPKPDVAKKMYLLLGADATLFSRIQKWDKKYRVVAGHLTVLIDYELFSGKTGEILWSHSKEVTLDTSGDTSHGLIVNLVTTAANTALADYVPVARQANNLALIAFPFGKYHPQFGLDKTEKVEVYKSKIEENGGALKTNGK